MAIFPDAADQECTTDQSSNEQSSTVWRFAEKTLPKGEDPLLHYGLVEWPYIIPNVHCSVCGCKVSAGFEHAQQLPEAICKEVEAFNNGQRSWSIAADEISAKCERWAIAWERIGGEPRLGPGDVFPPARWALPHIPDRHVYWTNGSVVVSDVVAKALRSAGVTGLRLTEVEISRVGTFEMGSPQFENVLADCNEPEDLFDAMPRLKECSQIGRFWILNAKLTTAESEFLEEYQALAPCKECGTRKVNQSTRIALSRRRSFFKRKGCLPNRAWPEVDMVASEIYPREFVVSRKFIQAITGLGLDNCRLIPIKIV